MITSGPEFDKFVVEPWMELEPPPLYKIIEIFPDHPYKILLKYLYEFCPSYKSNKKNNYYEDVTELYFRILDDFNKYGIAFNRYSKLFPDNKLCLFEDKKYGKPIYKLVNNKHIKKNFTI